MSKKIDMELKPYVWWKVTIYSADGGTKRTMETTTRSNRQPVVWARNRTPEGGNFRH
jgi:hypothetical protein